MTTPAREQALAMLNETIQYVAREAAKFRELADAEAAVVKKRNELFTHNDLDREAV